MFKVHCIRIFAIVQTTNHPTFYVTLSTVAPVTPRVLILKKNFYYARCDKKQEGSVYAEPNFCCAFGGYHRHTKSPGEKHLFCLLKLDFKLS